MNTKIDMLGIYKTCVNNYFYLFLLQQTQQQMLTKNDSGFSINGPQHSQKKH